MNLIFIETIDQIPFIKKMACEDFRIIAMTPKVLYALDKEKLEYKIPEDYYVNSLLQKEWEEYFKLSSKIISDIDKRIIALDPELSGLGYQIGPLKSNAAVFFNMFRQMVVNIFTIQKILDKERPEKVFYPAKHEDDLGYQFGFDKESIISHLIPIFAKDSFVSAEYEWQEEKVTAGDSFSLYGIKRTLSQNMRSFLGFFNNLIKKQGNILIFYEGYELDYIIPLLKSRYRIYYIKDLMKKWADYKEPVKGYYEYIASDKDIVSLFEYSRINFFSIIKRRFQYYLDHVFPRYAGMCPRINRDLKRLKIDLLVGSHSPLTVSENIAAICAKRMGIKIVSFQHGSYGDRFNHNVHVNDLDNCATDYFFAWGDDVKAYAARYNLKRVNIISVGSAWIDNIISKKQALAKKNRIPNVLYLPTTLRVSPKERMLPGEFSDNTYFSMQRKIVSELSKNKKIKLLVKLQYRDLKNNPIVDFIKENNFENAKLVKGNLEKLLKNIDLVVSDFMSTTLIQTLALDKNIMYYIDQEAMLIEPSARAALEKCIYCYSNIDEFIKAIYDYSESTERFPRKENSEYLRSYGTYLGDGKSAERALDYIEGIIKSNRHGKAA